GRRSASAWPRPPTSSAPCSFWPATRRRSSPAPTSSSTAASGCGSSRRISRCKVAAMRLAEMALEELRKRFLDDGEELPRGGLQQLLEDERQGARHVGELLQKRRKAAQAEERRLTKLSAFEQELWDQGIEFVGG